MLTRWPPAAPLLLLVAGLGGCAGWRPGPAPASTTAVAVPAAWAEAASGATGPPTPLANWWRRYNDPLLVQLVDQALRANPTLRGAQAALVQSRALRDVQAAAGWPTLGLSASGQRSRANLGAGSYTGNTFQAGFDASWEPDIFGGIRAAVAAADADVQVSAATLADTQVSLAAEVATDVLQLRGLQLRVRIAQASLASQSETLQLTQWRVQAGLLTALEEAQARAATEQTRALVPALQATLDQTAHALAALTGQAPGQVPGLLDAALDRPAGPAAAAASSPASPTSQPSQASQASLRSADPLPAIPADTLRQRPDVRAAAARMVAAAQRVAQADAARWPSLTLTGSLGASAATLAGLGQGAALVAAVLGTASATLFDGGLLRAQWRAQQAAFVQSATAYDATVLAALQDVEDGLVALRRLRESRISLVAAADAATTAATLAGQRYRSGIVDFQVLLDTQRSALTAQDSLATTETSLNTGQVRLYKALGGGWAEAPDARIATGPP